MKKNNYINVEWNVVNFLRNILFGIFSNQKWSFWCLKKYLFSNVPMMSMSGLVPVAETSEFKLQNGSTFHQTISSIHQPFGLIRQNVSKKSRKFLHSASFSVNMQSDFLGGKGEQDCDCVEKKSFAIKKLLTIFISRLAHQPRRSHKHTVNSQLRLPQYPINSINHSFN